MDLNLINLPEHLTSFTNSLTESPSFATLATELKRWLKLFLVGGAFETCRRVTFQAWDAIIDSFWITIDFEQSDRSYGKYLQAAPASAALVSC